MKHFVTYSRRVLVKNFLADFRETEINSWDITLGLETSWFQLPGAAANEQLQDEVGDLESTHYSLSSCISLENILLLILLQEQFFFWEQGITMNLSWKNFLFTIYLLRIRLTEIMLSKKRSVYQQLSEKQQGRVYCFLFCGWHLHHSTEIGVSITKIRFLHGGIFHIYFWLKVRYFTLVNITQDCDTVKFIFSISRSIRRDYSSKCKTAVWVGLKCWERDVRSRSWLLQLNLKAAQSLLN